MDNSEYQRLRESAWRESPGREARDRLGKSLTPESQREFQEEQRLTRCLRRLSDAPVSSNFTARVLQAARRPVPVRRESWWQRFAVHKWVPRVAVGALTVCIGLLSVQQYKATQHARMAHDLVSVSEVAQLSDVDWLDNFDTINRMSQVQAGDDELLTSLR